MNCAMLTKITLLITILLCAFTFEVQFLVIGN